MPLPEPKPGLVFRHDDLWAREAAGGRDQGKDRPACLVAARGPGNGAALRRHPADRAAAAAGDTVGIEIPPRVCAVLGLDEAPCRVIVCEHNVDEWPNAGLSPLPGRPGVFSYGFIPPGLFAQVKARFPKLSHAGRSGRVRR